MIALGLFSRIRSTLITSMTINPKLIKKGDNTMEPNYLIMLDYCTGQIIKIKLTEEEKSKSETYEDFEDFMRTELEDKYEFRTKDVCWMTAENLEERIYNL